MKNDPKRIEQLLKELNRQETVPFPALRKVLDVTTKKGVYVIRRGSTVLHVGSTPSGKDGIWGRLKDHLAGKSSFVKNYLGGSGKRLRKDCSFQALAVENSCQRAY